MKNVKVIGLCIIIGFAALGSLGSAVLFFVDITNNYIDGLSTWCGIIGTVASVILSVVAMIYSNKSSKEAEETFKKITNHYNNFYTQISEDLNKQGLGINSINRVIENNEKKLKK